MSKGLHSLIPQLFCLQITVFYTLQRVLAELVLYQLLLATAAYNQQLEIRYT